MTLINPSDQSRGLTFDLNTPYKSDYELRTQDTYVGKHNHLGVNYFRFHTPRIPNFSEFVQQINLPSISNLAVEQPTAFGVNIPHPSGKYIFEDFTVAFFVDENMNNWLEIYDWMRSIGSPGVKDNSERIPPEQFHSTGYFTILNSAYRPKFEVTLHNLFPIGLSGVQFSTVNSDADPVFCTVTFAYSHLEFNPVKTKPSIPVFTPGDGIKDPKPKPGKPTILPGIERPPKPPIDPNDPESSLTLTPDEFSGIDQDTLVATLVTEEDVHDNQYEWFIEIEGELG